MYVVEHFELFVIWPLTRVCSVKLVYAFTWAAAAFNDKHSEFCVHNFETAKEVKGPISFLLVCKLLTV